MCRQRSQDPEAELRRCILCHRCVQEVRLLDADPLWDGSCAHSQAVTSEKAAVRNGAGGRAKARLRQPALQRGRVPLLCCAGGGEPRQNGAGARVLPGRGLRALALGLHASNVLFRTSLAKVG